MAGELAELAAMPARLAAVEAKQDRILALLEQQAAAAPSLLVTVEEAARQLGVSLATARRRCKDSWPIVRVGRAVRVDLAKLRATTVAEQAAAARRGER